MYKKPLAILLSFLLLMTSFITAFSFSAAADSTNLVADGKFENGFSGWEVFNNTGNSSAAYEVVKEGDNSVLSAVPGLSMFKQVTLEAGVQYTVGFDFKFDTNATVPSTYDSFYRVGFANAVGALGNDNFVGPYTSGNKYYSVYVNQKNDFNNWKTHTFTYTPAADMTTYFVVGSYNGDGKANFFVDNVFLAKTSDLITVNTVAGEGGAVSSAVKTFKGDTVTVTAKASAGYLFDGWYNALGNKLSDEATYTFIADAGIELTAKFTLGEYNPNMITNGDFAVNNLEGFEVFKNGTNASSDFTFKQNGTDYILSGKAGHSLYKAVELKANTEYIMSFDFKFASANVPTAYDSFYRAGFVTSVAALGNSIFVGPYATNNKYYSIFANQKADPTNWKSHSFKFTPTEDMTVYAVIGSYNNQGESDFEVDNWKLYKSSDCITVTASASAGGTASGTATVLLGETVKLNAVADEGYKFLGWFDGDTLVSADAEYNHIANANISLVAKFESTAPISNYIVNGDFEKPFTTETIANTNVTAVVGKWGRIYSGVARMEATETKDFTSADSAEKNGTRYITSGATKSAPNYIRAFGQYVNLPAGDYILEFDAKSTVSDMFVLSVKKGQDAINLSSDLIEYLTQSSDWKHYTVKFTVDADSLYQIAFGGNIENKGEGDFSIDNVSLKVYEGDDEEDKEEEKIPNFLINGNFEQPLTTDKISETTLEPIVGKWGRIYSGVARMDSTESAAFTSADSAELNGTRYVTGGATKDDNQYVRTFGQYVELEPGDYTLSFIAKSNIANLFSAGIATIPGPIDPAKSIGVIPIKASDNWQLYTYKFTVTQKAVYQIAFGGNTQKVGVADFSIDNVLLCHSDKLNTVTAVTDGGGQISYPLKAVSVGDSVTVTATPDAGYVFKGWYKGNELVSADAAYTFTVTESVELKAMFELDLGDDTAIIKNGGFDINSTAGWKVVITAGGSNASVVVDEDTGSAVAKTTGKGAVAFMQKVNLKANTEYLISFDMKFDDFDSIPEQFDSFYRSGFIKDPNGTLSNSNFVGPNATGNLYKSLAGMITTGDKNAWNSISYTYTPTTDMETWFVIGSYNAQGVSNYSIDNISIVPKKDVTGVTVASVSHGGSGKVTSTKNGLVSPGESVTILATPNAGSVFGGWFINGTKISDAAEYTHTVTGNDVIYARFLDAQNPDSNQMLDNSDFATGDLNGWGVNNIDSATNTVEYVTVDGESYAKIGESDMLYQSVELEPYSTYMIRVTTRIPDIREKSYGVHDLGFFRFGISEYAHPNVLQSGALVKDPYSYTSSLAGQCDCEPNNRYHCAMKWGTYTYTYSNNSPDTVLANVVIGAPYCKSDVHIQKFEFVKFVDGIVDFESDILYGEDFFNNVKNPSFEEKLTDDNWGSELPSGWNVKSEENNKYLSISGNKSKTYSFSVRTGATYVVAFSLRTNKSGTSSVSIVDDKGNPWGDSFNLVTNKAIFQPKATGEWQRIGAHLYLADNEEGVANVNIKITAGTSVLDIDEITVTKLGYATHNTNPNIYGFEGTDYENLEVYDPTVFYTLDGKEPMDFGDDTDADTDSNTGSDNGEGTGADVDTEDSDVENGTGDNTEDKEETESDDNTDTDTHNDSDSDMDTNIGDNEENYGDDYADDYFNNVDTGDNTNVLKIAFLIVLSCCFAIFITTKGSNRISKGGNR